MAPVAASGVAVAVDSVVVVAAFVSGVAGVVWAKADVVTRAVKAVLAKSILNMVNSSLHRKVPAGPVRV